MSSFPVRTYTFCSSLMTYMMYTTSALLHKYTFVLMIKASSTHIQIFLKTESFFRLRKNKRHTRSVFESFSPVYTKTLKRWKYDSIPYKSCAVWRMQKPLFPFFHTKISKPLFFKKTPLSGPFSKTCVFRVRKRRCRAVDRA